MMKIAVDFPFISWKSKLNQSFNSMKSTWNLQSSEVETGNLILIKEIRQTTYTICRV